MQLLSLLRIMPKLSTTQATALRFVAFVGCATAIFYLVGNTVTFIIQLFDYSSTEVTKFVKVIGALLNRTNLDVDFLPQEFQDLTPTDEGVYTYALGNGNYNPLLFRRSSSVIGAWEWSDDGHLWFASDNFRESPNGVPEPPALIFILRLHVEHLIRKRLANSAAPNRRLPPPLELHVPGSCRLPESAPEVLCCPISHSLMRVPVVAPSGTTFEHDYIRQWVQQHNSDPVNGAPLTEGDLYPNLALREIIERWLQQGVPPGLGGAAAGGPDESPLPPHMLDLS